MADYIVSPPTQEPIALADVKLHIRQDPSVGTAEDTWLNSRITMARERGEYITQRKFITQTWGISLDGFPPAIELLRAPIQSVLTVQYLDQSQIVQLLDPASYVTDFTGLTGYIVPRFGRIFPLPYPEINSVTVRYVCGYGDTPASVPESIKDWMCLIIEDAYRNRGTTVHLGRGEKLEINPEFDAILYPFITPRV